MAGVDNFVSCKIAQKNQWDSQGYGRQEEHVKEMGSRSTKVWCDCNGADIPTINVSMGKQHWRDINVVIGASSIPLGDE